MNATSGSTNRCDGLGRNAHDPDVVEEADDPELARPEAPLHRRKARLPVDGVERLELATGIGYHHVGLGRAPGEVRHERAERNGMSQATQRAASPGAARRPE